MGFTKLDSGIVNSSIWSEPLATRVVWITMLALSNRFGLVKASTSGIQRSANVSVEQCEEAMDILQAPDLDSRSLDFDGRRIERVDGGWKILNYERYREFTYSDSEEALRQRKCRDKKKAVTSCDNSVTVSDTSVHSASVSASASVSGVGMQGEGAEKSKPKKEYSAAFEQFWALYPRKIAKGGAWKAFQAEAKNVEQGIIIEGVLKYIEHCKKDRTEEQFIKHPATWIRAQCWHDDFSSTIPKLTPQERCSL